MRGEAQPGGEHLDLCRRCLGTGFAMRAEPAQGTTESALRRAESSGQGRFATGFIAGNSTVMRVPSPGALSAVMLPP